MEKRKNSFGQWVIRAALLSSAVGGGALVGSYVTYRAASQGSSLQVSSNMSIDNPLSDPPIDVDVNITIASVGTVGDEINISTNGALIARAYVSCMTRKRVGELSLQSFGNNVAGSDGSQNFSLEQDFIRNRLPPVVIDGTPPSNLISSFNKLAIQDVCSDGHPIQPALILVAYHSAQMLMAPSVPSKNIYFQIPDETLANMPAPHVGHPPRRTHKTPVCG